MAGRLPKKRKLNKADKIARMGSVVVKVTPSTKIKRGVRMVHDQGAQKPTPEMLARVEYEYGPVKTEMNVQIGAAYRRKPFYLTLAKTSSRFSAEELVALSEYRTVFDRCERSPVASCLAITEGTARSVSPAGIIHASPALVEAKRKLRMIEGELGIYLGTMRSVALDDKSFSVVAMERYGCRARSWIAVNDPVMRNGKQVVIDGVPQFRATHREDVVPRSGRDREKIAHEFQRGLQRLVLAIARFGRYDINEVWVQPRTDGAAAIHRASHAPNGTYRMWGGAPIIDRVLDDLVAAHGDGLIFATPELARTALEEADKGRLKRLEPEELAA
ncbi:hypothetical protein [Sphingomonas melonis]|jgi:hypothetical protein|uniref:hypothetical protein n=1 Tax=Sphingomonas melonis TaxID=152682 RepID=UPI0003756109|nr:hypothetical protein [Sphingomonas melonis]